jgi:hypothetical protein
MFKLVQGKKDQTHLRKRIDNRKAGVSNPANVLKGKEIFLL